MTKLTTKSLTENYMLTTGGVSGGAKYSMLLSFNEGNNSVVVSQIDESTVVVNGTGSFYSKDDSSSESYNGKNHRTIYLDYSYEDKGNTYQVKDSLVFVDTDIKFEDFEVKVVNP